MEQWTMMLLVQNTFEIFLQMQELIHSVKTGKRKLTIRGSGLTLTSNEIKDIVKVIRSLENRGILLKQTTTRIASQEGGFLNFLKPLKEKETAGSQLMKSYLHH